jgi:hypothetical protein
MALKYKHKNKADISAAEMPFYLEKKEQENGAEVVFYILDVEGVVPREKLDEFRTNNVKLQKDLKEITEKFEDIDPEEARKLIAIKADLDAEKLMKKEGIDKVVEQRTLAMKADYEKKLKAAKEAADQMTSRLTEVEINQSTLSAATSRGLKSTAVLDITARARSVFKLVDGKPIAHDKDGKPIFGKDGVTPLSVADWVEDQVTAAPHLFEPSSGGGSGDGGNKGGAYKGGNPWDRAAGTWNFTEQMKLQKANPQLAEKLKKAATATK